MTWILPFVVAIAVGLPSIRGTFIRDDWDYVSGNPHVACAAPLRDIVKSPFQPLQTLGLYRPLTTASLRFDAWLGGESRPWIFHLTNLLLAAAGAALVARLSSLLVGKSAGDEAAARAALVAGLLFAVHPARTEAVCWISGRAENLMTAFGLLALVLVAGPPTLARAGCAAASAFLAACSKEQGFALALIVPVVAPPTNGKRLVTVVGVAVALALAFTLRFNVMHRTALLPGLAVLEDVTGGARAALGFGLLGDYVRLAFWPHPLLFEYDGVTFRFARGFLEPRVLAGVLAATVLSGAVLLRRRAPLVACAAALFLAPLLPVLHWFLPIGEDFAERFLALPVAGVALLAGAIAARWRAAGFGAAMLAIVAGGAAFSTRAADYVSERTLYEALLAARPGSPAAESLLGSALLLPDGGTRVPSSADAARADALLRGAVAKNPDLAAARQSVAAMDAGRRRRLGIPPLPAEMDFLIDTAKRFPDLPSVHGMLGIAYADLGIAQAAEKELRRELAIMPYDLNAAFALVRILEDRGDHEEARALLRDARARWETLWRRFPGFGPVAVTYARALSEGGRDVDGARAALRSSRERACRPADRETIERALAALGGN